MPINTLWVSCNCLVNKVEILMKLKEESRLLPMDDNIVGHIHSRLRTTRTKLQIK